jgi:predicted AAA+ superfamily ATPase
MRSFNALVPKIIEEHYSLSGLNWIEKGQKLVHNNRYFTIWAPRQAAKSTYFYLLADTLREEGYKVCYVNFENYKNATMKAYFI